MIVLNRYYLYFIQYVYSLPMSLQNYNLRKTICINVSTFEDYHKISSLIYEHLTKFVFVF